jgi:UDP-3-O-[3-hydroxymyristoyl] glucosamine N-acyltransferase
MSYSLSLERVLGILAEANIEGSLPPQISGLATLQEAQAGDLSFLGNSKYQSQVPESAASVIIVPTDYPGHPKAGQAFLRHPQPSLGLALICREIERQLLPPRTPGIHPSAVVSPSAEVSPEAFIGPLCVVEDGAVISTGCHLEAQVYIGAHARLAAHCHLSPHVTLAHHCELGERVRVHPGTSIGSDGFGYEFIAGQHEKVPQIGNVIVGPDVEIGANTTIDRARFGSTRIGAGSKIDNLVMIAHNVQVGKGCLLVAQCGISGSTVLGDYVIVGGQAGLAGHLKIGDRAKIGAQAGISKNMEPDIFVRGTPAHPYMEAQRIFALQKRLPEFFQRLKALENKSD